jgi:hypothetical protein
LSSSSSPEKKLVAQEEHVTGCCSPSLSQRMRCDVAIVSLGSGGTPPGCLPPADDGSTNNNKN